MAKNEKNLLPRLYHQNDSHRIIELWKTLVDSTTEDFRRHVKDYAEIIDPDTAPIQFVEIILAGLGNPFSDYPLTNNQKRKLAKLLIPMYNQKGLGKEKGIVSAARFLLNLELTIIDPHAYPEDGWHLEESAIGLTSYTGGRHCFGNMLFWTEDFTNERWIKSEVDVVSDATIGPSPWGRKADLIQMSTTDSEIFQEVSPRTLDNQNFTASLWLRSNSSTTISAILQSVDNPLDQSSAHFNVTNEWRRFVLSHTSYPFGSGNLRFILKNHSETETEFFAWGAQVVRDNDLNSAYQSRTTDGEDTEKAGGWIYHFFIQSPEVLNEDQEALLIRIADFMKPAHTHYGILEPADPGFIDHWEIGISELGVHTYVHD